MNIYRRSQAHNTKCIVVLLRADVTVTGSGGVVLQCKWRIVTVLSIVDFERSIKQCMESIIALYQNVHYDNNYL